jgi:hypothetical protein
MAGLPAVNVAGLTTVSVAGLPASGGLRGYGFLLQALRSKLLAPCSLLTDKR